MTLKKDEVRHGVWSSAVMFYLAWRIDARATIIKIIKLSYRRLCSAGEVHARNGCIENVALICLHSAPHFFFAFLSSHHSCPCASCISRSCRFLALRLLTLASSWPFRNFTFTCHLSFTWQPCVCHSQSKVTPHVRFSTITFHRFLAFQLEDHPCTNQNRLWVDIQSRTQTLVCSYCASVKS